MNMKTKTSTRKETSEITKQKIYKTGIELFKTMGYEKTSIQDICKASGVSYGSFYHFFGYKHGIIIQSAVEFSKESAHIIALTKENIDQPFDSILAYFSAFGKHCEKFGYDFTAAAFCTMNIMKNADGSFIDYTNMDAIRQLIAAAQEAGTFSTKYGADEALNLYYVTCMGVLLSWTMEAGTFCMETSLKNNINMISLLFQV